MSKLVSPALPSIRAPSFFLGESCAPTEPANPSAKNNSKTLNKYLCCFIIHLLLRSRPEQNTCPISFEMKSMPYTRRKNSLQRIFPFNRKSKSYGGFHAENFEQARAVALLNW